MLSEGMRYTTGGRFRYERPPSGFYADLESWYAADGARNLSCYLGEALVGVDGGIFSHIQPDR